MSGPQTRERRAGTRRQSRNNSSLATDYSALRALYGHQERDPEAQFMSALERFGFQVEDIIADGGRYRARLEGDRPGERSGWYTLRKEGIAEGEFGDRRTGESRSWRADDQGRHGERFA